MLCELLTRPETNATALQAVRFTFNLGDEGIVELLEETIRATLDTITNESSGESVAALFDEEFELLLDLRRLYSKFLSQH